MNIADIIAIGIIILSALIGFKNGAIKTFVKLIGFVAIVIVAYQFKDVLASVFIKHLPFFKFGGKLSELYAINILVYEGISFAVIFILLYCILNILINLSGLLDLIVKFTIILELPSKIIGTILGVVEGIVLVFVLSFILLQIGSTQKYIMDSKISLKIVDRTPVVNDVFKQTIVASEEIYKAIDNSESKSKFDVNLDIVRNLIRYGIVTDEVVQEAIDNGKLHLPNVVVAS